MEEAEIAFRESGPDHPILFIPKHLTTLETKCAPSDNVFINLNITTADTEGNDLNVYSGFCNVKVIDSSNDDNDADGEMYYPSDTENVLGEVTLPDSNDSNESDMLIDPTYNPYISDAMETEDNYTIYQSHDEHITVRQHGSYLKNVNHYSESVQYSQYMEFEHKKFKRMKTSGEPKPQHGEPSLNKERMIAKEKQVRAEMNYVDFPCDVAVKQLMSLELQGTPRQQRTILLFADGSQEGQTIQRIAIDDPQAKCRASGAGTSVPVNNSCQKKYQCEKCKQIFYQISAFRQHIQVKHTPKRKQPDVPANNVGFLCLECKKSFKSREKFEMHCLGHGNPDVECSTCRKVFASKSTLQNHIKIHLRKHKCPYCRKTYQKFKDLTAHLEKAHLVSKCDICNSTASTLGLEKHKEQHKFDVVLAQKPEPGASNSERNLSVNDWPDSAEDYSVPYEETKQDHDSVIAQATSNELFLLHAKKGKKGKKCKEKRCNVCLKNFDRRSDLKRHLIEHILRSSLEKDPIDDSGILHLTCEVCQSQTFSRIDEYKAHLREHAKLTTYKCTVCGKTFSDSSNFSKHKKVHGNQHFQCDICLRKFNTKKTLIAHIEYHNANRPIKCYYCNKKYHFQSALNKHIKFVHEQIVPRYKCTICDDFLSTVKEKWEHEWLVHQVRKVVVDCLICGAKFRKYSELKRHCQLTHKVEIPPARRLLRKRDDRK